MPTRLRRVNACLTATMFAVSTVLGSSIAFAATQGTLGATSTGVINISITKTAQAQISGLSDIVLPSYTIGGGDQALSTTACVYSSTAGGGYTVKATGSGAASAFTLDDGASHTLPYSVVWNSGGVGALGATGASLTTNVTSGSLSHAATDSATCAGSVPGPTAQINVNVLGSSLDATPAGTYTGTLTLLISPI